MTDSKSEQPAWETPAYDSGSFSAEPGPAEFSNDWATTQLEPIRVPTPEQSMNRRASLVGVIVVVIIAVFGAAMGLLATVNLRRAAIDSSLTVGSCVRLTEDSGVVGHLSVGCEESISYTVATVSDGDVSCPGTNYQSISITSANRIVKTACLVQNLEYNACYKITKTVDKIAKVDCGDASADFKVALRNDYADDPTRCTDDQKYEGYSIPGRTYCLASPLNG